MAFLPPRQHASSMRIPASNLKDITTHLADKGWAIAADVIDAQQVNVLRQVVLDRCSPCPPGGTRLDGKVIQHAPAVLDLLRTPRWMSVMRACIGEDDVVVHRTAALLRMGGSPQVGWHSDFDFAQTPPTNQDQYLNRGEWPNGPWFYLNGSHPDRGGLAVVEGSHRPDWQPPTDWDRSSGWDLPGVVELHSEPGDLVLFGARTWHAARAYQADIPRLSLGVGLRPARITIPYPHPPSAEAHDFLTTLPADVAPLFRGYAGWIVG